MTPAGQKPRAEDGLPVARRRVPATLLVLAVLFGTPLSSWSAVLPHLLWPQALEAGEVLKIRVLERLSATATDSDCGDRELVYRVEVIAIARSVSGLSAGDRITLAYLTRLPIEPPRQTDAKPTYSVIKGPRGETWKIATLTPTRLSCTGGHTLPVLRTGMETPAFLHPPGHPDPSHPRSTAPRTSPHYRVAAGNGSFSDQFAERLWERIRTPGSGP